MKSLKNITGLLIKINREKLGLKQEYLCKGICSVSYLSKIEKGNVIPSDEIVKMLFNKLNIDFNKDEEFVEGGKRLFNKINKSRYFQIPEDKEVLQELRDNKSKYLNSPLNIEYQLFQLYDKLYDNQSEINNIDILKYKDYMDDEQLYRAFLITGSINSNIELLEKAKKIKYTAEVVYQIGFIKWLEGNYHEAIELNLEALNLAYDEGAIILQIGICFMLGNLYMDFHLPTMEKYYNKALLLSEFASYNDINYLINYHMGIAYTTTDFIKAQEYLLEALRICPKDNKDYLEMIYQKLSFLYLRYKKREDAKIYYEKSKEINTLKLVNELIEIMVKDENYINSEEYLNKLINIYNKSKRNNKHSNTKFYGHFLIEAYKANRKYKDALLVTEYLYLNIQ